MVVVKLFANFREVAGKREVEVEAKSLKELLENLVSMYPEFHGLMGYAVVVVNGKIADKEKDLMLKKEDTVAIFPPVSGGGHAF